MPSVRSTPAPTPPQPSVYLDHAATTPMLPCAIEAMNSVFGTVGNASSLHTTGRAARRRMEEARETLAGLLGARPSEIIFTAGGTESDNLGVKGIFWARRDADPKRRRIITSPVEHHAILPRADPHQRSAHRHIVITEKTKHVRVDNGDTVEFKINGTSFTWHFLTLQQETSFDLSKIAPAGALKQKVTVYVASHPLYRS